MPPGRSAAEVATHYRGFDGDLWPATDFDAVPKNEFGLVDANHLSLIRSIVAGMNTIERVDLIHLEAMPANATAMEDTSRFLGYDFGHFVSPLDKFSVILNEVLFGQYDELRRFAQQLNDHLLLSERGDRALSSIGASQPPRARLRSGNRNRSGSDSDYRCLECDDTPVRERAT